MTHTDSELKEIYNLTLSCINRPGIVAGITVPLFELGADILEAQQYDDLAEKRFFMRVAFSAAVPAVDIAVIRDRLAPVAQAFSLRWQLRAVSQKHRVLILASKADHCLTDLLYRRRIGELPMQLVGIVSNHPRESLNLPPADEVPYHHLPVTADTKDRQEAQIMRIVEESGAELVVLARYMQILSGKLCAYLAGRCINIHHSFLPGFKGAKPYTQAFEHGVKMIGATAHYVTEDLDEGPIIAQDTLPVSHVDTPDTLSRKGRDIERRMLALAVQYHLEDRVLLNGRKTVVFRD
jgi:formyltetrahydrofolate deformylase